MKQGNVYIPTSKKPTITQRFADFFTRAAAFSNGIYPGGTGPIIQLHLRSQTSARRWPKLSITIDGQKADLATGGQPQQFSCGRGAGASRGDAYRRPGIQLGGSSNYPGTWAIFEYLLRR